MKNILFYKYVHIKNLEAFRLQHLDFCIALGLKGKILVAEEGINGCVSGDDEAILQYIDYMHKDPRFADIDFKEGYTTKHTFKKMFVRIRKEIVTSGMDVNVFRESGRYVEPQDFKKMLDSGEELILIDARNDYESKIGRFHNARTPPLKTFREFPKVAEELQDKKDKKIVMYCTGGIRCEKATAYFVKQGFTNVFHLHGGIIKYGEVCGDAHWEGKCFVFDERGAIPIDPKKQAEPITQCECCYLPCDTYHNCKRTVCDRRFIACDECLKRLDGCCSKQCRNTVHNV